MKTRRASTALSDGEAADDLLRRFQRFSSHITTHHSIYRATLQVDRNLHFPRNMMCRSRKGDAKITVIMALGVPVGLGAASVYFI